MIAVYKGKSGLILPTAVLICVDKIYHLYPKVTKESGQGRFLFLATRKRRPHPSSAMLNQQSFLRQELLIHATASIPKVD